MSAIFHGSGNNPSILVLHSYHSSFRWNEEMSQGIRKVFSENYDRYYVVEEYMDTKRKTDSITSRTLSDLYKQKFSNVKFDLIIATDDDALQFMLRRGHDIFPDVPVVFCGINNYSPEMMAGSPPMTGVLEMLDVKGTVRAALEIFPGTLQIWFIGDNSTTAHDLSKLFRIKDATAFPEITFHYLHENGLDELLPHITNLPSDALIMLWPFLSLGRNLLADVGVSTQFITSNTYVPVFGFWHFMMGHGIVGGKLLSGITQGESAAQLAVRIINGEKIEDIPILEVLTNEYYFDYEILKKFSLKITELPQNSNIINLPSPVFVQHRKIMLGLIAALVLFALIFAIQVFESKRIRRMLQTELEFTHELLNALPNPVYYTLNNKTLVACNKAFEKLAGQTENKMAGKEIPTIYSPFQIEEHRKINEDVIRNHTPAILEGQIQILDNVRDVIFYKSPIYNKRTRQWGMIETIVDITDKKLANEEIRQSEERYSLVTRATQDGIFDQNFEKGDIYISSRLKEILGFEKDELPFGEAGIEEILHTSDVRVFSHQFDLIKQEVKNSFDLELKLRKKDGTYIWTECKFFAIYKKKTLLRFVGSISDIQDRKDKELSLKKWEDIFDNTKMGVATFNAGTYHVESSNPTFAAMHGYSVAEALALDYDQLLAPEAEKNKEDFFSVALQEGHHVFETIHHKKDGEFIPVMVDITAVRNNLHELLYFIVNIQDITQRKKQENKITQMLRNEQSMNEALRSSEEEIKQSLYETVRLKEKIEDSQIRFLRFINGTSDFAILKDKNHRYIMVNEAFARLHGLTPADINGKTDEDFADKDVSDFEKLQDEVVLKEQKTIIYEKYNGGRFFETRKFPVYYEDNQVGIGAFIRDVTHQRIIEKQVQENEQRLKTLLQNSNDLILLINADGIIKYSTDFIESFTGYSLQEVTGNHFTFYLHPEDRFIFEKRIEKLLTTPGEPVYLHHRMKHKDQGYFNIQTIANNHLDNPLINAIIFTCRDVSVELQARELKKNIALAQKSAEIKQQFLANMSHEIRTPMNGIVGMIEFLMKTQLNDEQEDYVSTIKSSADSLLNIINDILDFSKIEAGKLNINPTPLQLKKFVNDSPRIFHALLKQKNLSFYLHFDESLPEYLNVDSIRLNQVLTNLLSNAIKFTPSGNIFLRVFPDKITYEKIILRFEVEDTGIGIAADAQANLFKPFMQVDSSLTRSIEGTGLGLSISQRIVELMGGEIGIISMPGKGSMFWFTIETTIPEYEKVKTFLAENENIAINDLNLEILLVEDKFVNQKVIKLMLESMGCRATIANNGKEALDLLEKHHAGSPKTKPLFDIILMDIQMPVMDGITATKLLRRNYQQYEVIIGLSANVLSSDVEIFLKSGLDDYIIKPAKSEDLYKKLLYWSEKSKSGQNKEKSDSVIETLKREPVIDDARLSLILEQAQDNQPVLKELFHGFYSDVTDHIHSIRNLISKPDQLKTHIQNLHQISSGMGALQAARTCEYLEEYAGVDEAGVEVMLDFLEKSILSYLEAALHRAGLEKTETTSL
jgi:PAS domain S-box-containing protein